MSKTFSAKLVIMFVFIIAMIKALSLSAHASSPYFLDDNLRLNECYGYDSATDAEYRFGCPNYGGLFFLNNGSTYTFCYVFPAAYPLSNLSFSRTVLNLDGTKDVMNYSVPVNGSDILPFTYNGVNYKVYYYTFADTYTFYGVPFYCYDGTLTSALVVSGASAYVMLLPNNVSIDNVSIDTSSMESILTDISNTNSSIDTNVLNISTDVNDIRQNGTSGSGITQDIKDLMVRYDTWLTLIFFAVGLSLFRVVLRSVGDKFSRMR